MAKCKAITGLAAKGLNNVQTGVCIFNISLLDDIERTNRQCEVKYKTYKNVYKLAKNLCRNCLLLHELLFNCSKQKTGNGSNKICVAGC